MQREHLTNNIVHQQIGRKSTVCPYS